MAKLSTLIDEILIQEENWSEYQSDVWGLPTGFPKLDRLTGGWQPAEVFVLAAPTSQGKTSFALQSAFFSAFWLMTEEMETGKYPGKVVVFSPEMTPFQIVTRQASQDAGVDYRRVRTGKADDEERARWRKSMTALKQLEPYMDLHAGVSLDVEEVIAATNRVHLLEGGVRLVIVDYLQRITVGVGNNSAYDRASTISIKMKNLANDTNIPIVLVSQMNRDAKSDENKKGEFRPPQIHHIRDSGRIEEDADKVGLLWVKTRQVTDPDMPLEQDDERDRAAGMILAKNRNGPLGQVDLFFDDRLTRFGDGGSYDDMTIGIPDG